MKILETTAQFQAWRRELPGTESVGFVPTMGALHAGHASLLERSAKENEHTVLSIFVNPTQFNNAQDLEKYPRTWEHDLAVAERAGVAAIFAPKSMEELYPDSYRYQVVEKEDSKILCGEHRPGHFEGMLTVVLKLLHVVRADRAYFGEKDYQQLSLIQGMARAFFLPTEIVPCATLREADGLAMSSRNLRLTAAEREKAPELHRILSAVPGAAQARASLEEAGFRVEYCEDRVLDGHSRRFVAAWLGAVRLIDNVPSPGASR